MRHLITIIFSLLLSNISAQQLTERYAALDLGLGPRSISTTAGSYALGFDTNIETFLLEKEIEDSFNYLGLNLGLSFGKYRSLSHNCLLYTSPSPRD